jgi:hypothetical protein
MSRYLLRPYPYLPDALTLTVTPAELDYEIQPGGSLLITEDLSDSAEIHFNVSIDVVRGFVDGLVPAGERADPPVALGVAIRTVSARSRSLQILGPVTTELEYVTTLSFRRGDLLDSVELRPLLIRTDAGDEDSGFAWFKGAALADGKVAVVLFEERPMPTGAHIDIVYEDFRSSRNELRRQQNRAIFALDLEGDEPVLILNSAHERLESVTRSTARRGVPRRVRDATYDTIVCQAWTSMIAASLTALASEGDLRLEPREMLDLLPGWQQRVLHYWATRLFPELGDRQQAIAEIADYVRDPGLTGSLQQRVSLAVQELSRSDEAFAGLVAVLTGEGL